MLVLRCAACRRKLWKYDKFGPGEVLRCHKERITQLYEAVVGGPKVMCPCGKEVGIDKGGFYKMIARAFTYRGTKRNSAF